MVASGVSNLTSASIAHWATSTSVPAAMMRNAQPAGAPIRSMTGPAVSEATPLKSWKPSSSWNRRILTSLGCRLGTRLHHRPRTRAAALLRPKYGEKLTVALLSVRDAPKGQGQFDLGCRLGFQVRNPPGSGDFGICRDLSDQSRAPRWTVPPSGQIPGRAHRQRRCDVSATSVTWSDRASRFGSQHKRLLRIAASSRRPAQNLRVSVQDRV